VPLVLNGAQHILPVMVFTLADEVQVGNRRTHLARRNSGQLLFFIDLQALHACIPCHGCNFLQSVLFFGLGFDSKGGGLPLPPVPSHDAIGAWLQRGFRTSLVAKRNQRVVTIVPGDS